MSLRKVTLTGADDSVAPTDLVTLSARYPFVEWGILISKKRQGEHRYPSPSWMSELMSVWPKWRPMPKHGHRLAFSTFIPSLSAHVCGRWARDICSGKTSVEMETLPLFRSVINRIQLNGDAKTLSPAMGGIELLKGMQIIFQYKDDGAPVKAQTTDTLVPLFDKSGGLGIMPQEWPAASSIGTYPIYGYAGGLGPDNLDEQLRSIDKASEGEPFWVDMETSLRTKDGLLFDLEKCERCLAICERFVSGSA